MIGIPARSDKERGWSPEESGSSEALLLEKQAGKLAQVYEEWIDSVDWKNDEPIFIINGKPVHWAGGRLLREEHLGQTSEYGSIFYPYNKGPLSGLLPLEEPVQRSADFWESLFGTTEKEVRNHCAARQFLNHFVFLNRACLDSLHLVERDILRSARKDKVVLRFLNDLKIVYSFERRQTKGYRENLSLHSFGLALDLVPESYHGKQVFWRWSRVFHKEDWYLIPPENRWSPPQAVIDAFEAHGFAWGGKWLHFDTIHFEFRPEIVLVPGVAR